MATKIIFGLIEAAALIIVIAVMVRCSRYFGV
jgi:hypothetical protein